MYTIGSPGVYQGEDGSSSRLSVDGREYGVMSDCERIEGTNESWIIWMTGRESAVDGGDECACPDVGSS